MMKFKLIEFGVSDISINESMIESVILISNGSYELRMTSGKKYLIQEDQYLIALLK